MNILFFSAKDYEIPYLQAANKTNRQLKYVREPLSLETASKAIGFETISIFISDDGSAPVLEALFAIGVRFIAIRAVGYEHVDIKKAGELGISVVNVPDYSPFAIAEHAIALMMALNRNLVVADKQVHQQNFTTDKLIGFDLKNKTIGIIGTGKIGSTLAKIMHGFGCKLLGYDIQHHKVLTELYGLEYVSLEELCNQSDIISVHTCLTPETKYMVNASLIKKMKKGVMLINTSRGGCIKTTDLLQGLETGQIGYFGADVYEQEKGIFFNDFTGKELKDDVLKKLLTFENVLITPHQAFATREALTNIAETTFESIQCWEEGRRSPCTLTKIINLEDTSAPIEAANLTHA
jgi:D-lactate dehydrogenase